MFAVRTGLSCSCCRSLLRGAGNVAASINWNCTAPLAGLPEAVLDGIRSSGFKCPFEPVRLSNLRLIKPDGLVDMRPDAAPLAEQLASVEP